jgi:hypothetical protein
MSYILCFSIVLLVCEVDGEILIRGSLLILCSGAYVYEVGATLIKSINTSREQNFPAVLGENTNEIKLQNKIFLRYGYKKLKSRTVIGVQICSPQSL